MLSQKNLAIYNENVLQEDLLNADAFGTFCLETLEIRLNFTAKNLDDIERYQDIVLQEKSSQERSVYDFKALTENYSRFIQTHNHELVHFFQVLALPTFQLIWASNVNWFKLETVVLLQAMDEKIIITPDRDLNVLNLLNDNKIIGDPKSDDLFESVSLYQQVYRKEFDGLSVLHLVEGMAHAISLQLLDEPSDDALNLSDHPLYSSAFKVFDQGLKGYDLELRWRLLLFIYACYFSLHSRPSDIESSFNPVQIFYNYCQRAKHYFEALKELGELYMKTEPSYNKAFLSEIFEDCDLELASEKQLAHMHAFVDIIDEMSSEAEKWNVNIESVSIENMEFLIDASQVRGIRISDKYLLLKMLSIPKNFVWIREIYDDIFGAEASEKPFSFSDESMFYEFMRNFRKAMKKDRVACCEKHGVVDFGKKVLRCKETDGFAFYCEKMFSRPAWEIFKW